MTIVQEIRSTQCNSGIQKFSTIQASRATHPILFRRHSYPQTMRSEVIAECGPKEPYVARACEFMITSSTETILHETGMISFCISQHTEHPPTGFTTACFSMATIIKSPQDDRQKFLPSKCFPVIVYYFHSICAPLSFRISSKAGRQKFFALCHINLFL